MSYDASDYVICAILLPFFAQTSSYSVRISSPVLGSRLTASKGDHSELMISDAVASNRGFQSALCIPRGHRTFPHGIEQRNWHEVVAGSFEFG